MASLKHHPPLEKESNNMHALISGRSILAGFLISMLSMFGLLGLGLAVGGIGLNENTSFKSAGIFTGIWFLGAAFVSLFVGSYFAARVSKFRTGRIGSAQGLVIASLFLGIFFYQGVSSLGSAGSLAGDFLGRSGSVIVGGAQEAYENPTIANTMSNITEDGLAELNLNLRSSPQIVAQGLASRLFRGDSEGAKNFLAREAGITPTEADARILQMKLRVDKVADDAKAATASAMKSAGWSLFLLVMFGALSAVGGGAWGSAVNFRRPLIRQNSEDYTMTGRAQQHA